ncbi:winged helix-turn-helix transcriptional regulator [Streptomyces kaempferi]
MTHAKTARKDRDREEACSIARSLEIVGDRWTMLVLREAALQGVTRFADFRDRLGIAPDVLTLRLATLVEGASWRSGPTGSPVRAPGSATT